MIEWVLHKSKSVYHYHLQKDGNTLGTISIPEDLIEIIRNDGVELYKAKLTSKK